MSEGWCCPSCGGFPVPGTKAYPGLGQELSLGIEGIAECSVCGLAYAFPLPNQERLDNYYTNGIYWHRHVIPGSAGHMHSLSQGNARANWCKRHLSSPVAVADVGAGYGWQAEALVMNLGAAVASYSYLEPDDLAADAVLARNLNLARRRIDSLPSGANYDLVFLNQVLEHVARPNELLRTVFEALAPGGHIYVETPHRDDHLKPDVFPHMLFFSKDALARLIRQSGFELLVVEEFGQMPKQNIYSLPLRFVFRVAAAMGWQSTAIAADALLWNYQSTRPGIWLRTLARRV